LHYAAAAKYLAVGAVRIAGIGGGGGGGGGSAASFGAGAQARGTTINTKPGYDQVFADGVQSYQESQNPGQESDGF
jgi:hypothetical protein